MKADDERREELSDRLSLDNQLLGARISTYQEDSRCHSRNETVMECQVLARSGHWPKQAELQCRRSAVLSKRQFADVDRARRCQDRNFEMICLYDVRNVARAVRDNVDTGLASQAVIEQSRAT
jgi:hypothetical protein